MATKSLEIRRGSDEPGRIRPSNSDHLASRNRRIFEYLSA